MSEQRRINADIDVIYSPDDGGWYSSHYGLNRTTHVYPTWEEARDAARAGRWDES